MSFGDILMAIFLFLPEILLVLFPVVIIVSLIVAICSGGRYGVGFLEGFMKLFDTCNIWKEENK